MGLISRYTIFINQTPMKKLFAAAAASLAFAAPAVAQPYQVFEDTWAAPAATGGEHIISVERVDREGDVLITVRRNSARGLITEQYWINCENDLIAYVQPGAEYYPWSQVDHRKMEGWYSDVACRLN